MKRAVPETVPPVFAVGGRCRRRRTLIAAARDCCDMACGTRPIAATNRLPNADTNGRTLAGLRFESYAAIPYDSIAAAIAPNSGAPGAQCAR